MPDETKPQDPNPTMTSSTTPHDPLTELPREGGIVGATSGGIAAPTAAAPPAPSGGNILGVGEDVANRLGLGAPVFGEVLRKVGFAVARGQQDLDAGVIAGVKKLNDTKIEVVTQVVQELNDDGLPDASLTKLIKQKVAVTNFFLPPFHQFENVELCMDLTVGEFHGEQGVQFNAEQERTSVGGGGTWGFGGWFNFSTSNAEQSVTIANKQDVSWSSGQVRVLAQLAPRRTGQFNAPATVEIGPQIYVSQGAISEEKTDEVVTSRSVDMLIEVRKRNGSPMQAGVNVVVDAGGLLPDFGTAGSVTDAKGRVKVKLTRNLSGAKGFQKFPMRAALQAKSQNFTVML